MRLREALDSATGGIILSVLLGLGLAAVFRRACSGAGCVVVQAPDLGELQRYAYRVDSDCFKYTPEPVPCPMKDNGTPRGG